MFLLLHHLHEGFPKTVVGHYYVKHLLFILRIQQLKMFAKVGLLVVMEQNILVAKISQMV